MLLSKIHFMYVEEIFIKKSINLILLLILFKWYLITIYIALEARIASTMYIPVICEKWSTLSPSYKNRIRVNLRMDLSPRYVTSHLSSLARCLLTTPGQRSDHHLRWQLTCLRPTGTEVRGQDEANRSHIRCQDTKAETLHPNGTASVYRQPW